MIEHLLSLDRSLFLFFNSRIANPIFDFLFVTITNGKFWIVPAVAASLFFLKIKRSQALWVIALALITVAISDPVCVRLLKPLFHRLRPCHPDVLVEGGRFLLGHKRSLSFPSAHACNVFAQAALFTCFFRRYWPWFLLFASFIAFSRVYVGVHYPLDILGGAVVGSGVGFLVFFVSRRIATGVKKWKSQKNELSRKTLME